MKSQSNCGPGLWYQVVHLNISDPSQSCSSPLFSVQLPAPTTDMIEVSICADESTDNEDTPIELLEICVQ